jgi:type II secretion system protein N
MKRLGRWAAVFIYVLAVAIFCAYYLFPSETVKNYVAVRIQRINPHLSLSIGDASPVFPPGLRLRRTVLEHSGEPFLDIDEITFYPDVISLLGRRRAITYRMGLAGGNVAGTATLMGDLTSAEVTLSAAIDRLRLKSIPFVQRLSRGQVDGVLSGTVDYRTRTDNRHTTVNAEFGIAETVIHLRQPLFGQPRLDLALIRAEVALRDRNLEIRRLEIDDDQLKGRLSGTGVVHEHLGKTSLRLSGRITPGGMAPDQRRPAAGGGRQTEGLTLPLTIEGTLDDLRFSLK